MWVRVKVLVGSIDVSGPNDPRPGSLSHPSPNPIPQRDLLGLRTTSFPSTKELLGSPHDPRPTGESGSGGRMGPYTLRTVRGGDQIGHSSKTALPSAVRGRGRRKGKVIMDPVHGVESEDVSPHPVSGDGWGQGVFLRLDGPPRPSLLPLRNRRPSPRGANSRTLDRNPLS